MELEKKINRIKFGFVQKKKKKKNNKKKKIII